MYGEKMKQGVTHNTTHKTIHRKKIWYGFVCLALCIALTGCTDKAEEVDPSPSTDAASETATEAVSESANEAVMPRNEAVRRIAETLPEAGKPVEAPGDRTHFSFTEDGKTYEFTETETLWLYNQSVIGGSYDTQFLLDVKGKKVILANPSAEEQENLHLEDWTLVYEDDKVEIFREEEKEKAEEDEKLLLTVYDMLYEVTYWPDLVNKGTITLPRLYEALAQMGTSIVPVTEPTVSDLITAMSANPVFEQYRMAFREGVSYSGFIFCSPKSNEADHENISIFMSIRIPVWEEYATVQIEPIPDFKDRLEETGETFDGHPILVDYTGELKYFVLGDTGTCITVDGMPGENGQNRENYSAREAAYILNMTFE